MKRAEDLAGIMAAVQAVKMGKTTVLAESGKHLGGLTTGGLGATDIGNKILSEFHPESVTIEVKKFSIPEARYVSVSLTKQRLAPEGAKRGFFWWQRWS